MRNLLTFNTDDWILFTYYNFIVIVCLNTVMRDSSQGGVMFKQDQGWSEQPS